MRCLALAQAWQDAGGDCLFAMSSTIPAMNQRIQAESIGIVTFNCKAGSVEDAKQCVQLAFANHVHAIVVDGYCFGAEFQRVLSSAGLRILVIDDLGEVEHYYADLILNQNIQAHENLYSHREIHTQLLLGPRYALLRREFLEWREWKRSFPSAVGRILVSMGGSDAGNATAKILPLLKQFRVEVLAIAGGGNPHTESLEREAISQESLQLLRDVANMPALMASADVAIVAAGSICWEICAMGLPAILVVNAPNQEDVARALAQGGAALAADPESSNLTESMPILVQQLMDSLDLRKSLSSKARELVDMRGAARVAAALRELPRS